MKALTFVISILWTLLIGTSWGKQPNIVIIVMDDVGWHDVGYHGSAISTPNIDGLAREGVRLENYYTASLCTPTRGMLLTGRHMIHLGLQGGIIRNNEAKCLPIDEVTLAQRLKQEGYSTYIVGKWHLGSYKKECTPNERGFDHFFGMLGGESDHYTHMIEYGRYDLNRDDRAVAKEYYGQYSTYLYTTEAKTIIAEHDKSKPLFLYLAYQAAHVPLEVPYQYMEQYEYIDNSNRRTFAGMVTCMDEAIGDVVEQLKKSNMWDNTILFVSTDNGGAVKKTSGNNWPLKGGKSSLFEGGVRVVAFVTSPLLPSHVQGTANHELIHVTDWFPTFVKLAGGTIESGGDKPLYGVDQWNTLSGVSPSPRDHVLVNIDQSQKRIVQYELIPEYKLIYDITIKAAIRVGDWKLLTGPQAHQGWLPPPETGMTVSPVVNDRRFVSLFNLAEDPNERIEISEEYPAVVEMCLRRLAEYYENISPLVKPAMFEDYDHNVMPNNIIAPWQI